MRKHNKSILSWVLILAMLVCTVPVSATETQYLEPVSATYINPLYAEVITEEDLDTAYSVAPVSEDTEYYTDIGDASKVVREYLKQRAESFEVNFLMYDFTQELALAKALEVAETAMHHTGAPEEGDYILWQHGGYQYGFSGYYDPTDGGYYLTFYYLMTYYTDAAQEQELTQTINAFIDAKINDGMSDYEKFCVIYDWICDNVVYDYENLEDESYKLKYTAYAAMIDKTAVCQGYANLLYRMLLEVGIDNRIISGTGNGGDHGWNIVKLSGQYYDVDATWDASWHQAGAEYQWCLKNEAEFGQDHIRNEEYSTTEFNAQYPMATEDYDLSTAIEAVSGYQVLTSDTCVDWLLTGDVYVDLAGFDMTGTIDLNGYQIYGMDSTTNKYTCDSMGTFNCADENGDEIVPTKHWKGTEEQIGSIKRYMTIDTQDGYTFHRFYLGITHISMKPTTDGVGYKAIVAGDEMVFSELDQDEAFGYSMQLGDFDTVTAYCGLDGFISGHPIGLRIDCFNMDDYGETALYAKVMLKLSDGTVISTGEISMTVRGMLEQINENYTSLLSTQLQSLRDMLARHPITEEWGLNNLLGS